MSAESERGPQSRGQDVQGSSNQLLTEMISVRMHPDQRKQVEDAARILGVGVPTFMANAVVNGARRIRDEVGGERILAKVIPEMEAETAAQETDTRAFLEGYLRDHPVEENPDYVTRIAWQVAAKLFPADPEPRSHEEGTGAFSLDPTDMPEPADRDWSAGNVEVTLIDRSGSTAVFGRTDVENREVDDRDDR
jgi:hypothetical protein